jgi:hypothetical protein
VLFLPSATHLYHSARPGATLMMTKGRLLENPRSVTALQQGGSWTGGMLLLEPPPPLLPPVATNVLT